MCGLDFTCHSFLCHQTALGNNIVLSNIFLISIENINYILYYSMIIDNCNLFVIVNVFVIEISCAVC